MVTPSFAVSCEASLYVNVEPEPRQFPVSAWGVRLPAASKQYTHVVFSVVPAVSLASVIRPPLS